jgi:hypothetical protein
MKPVNGSVADVRDTLKHTDLVIENITKRLNQIEEETRYLNADITPNDRVFRTLGEIKNRSDSMTKRFKSLQNRVARARTLSQQVGPF